MRARWCSIALLLSTGCMHSAGQKPIADPPAWVDQLIETLAAQPVQYPPASVLEYQYAGSTYYFVPASCCDQWSTLYDREGAVVCHPDGGFGNTGDGGCTDFLRTGQLESVVWQDPRTTRAPSTTPSLVRVQR